MTPFVLLKFMMALGVGCAIIGICLGFGAGMCVLLKRCLANVTADLL